ncbi:hypothetical protein [Mucilaginibacter sp.]|uniref:hypothetical protein n=1 Tax=Mucilaginibacter sp. TaxID=1882438 RepID=UPI0025D4B5A9|nr:hypothetical protein [Mucilaginibacter sp.]
MREKLDYFYYRFYRFQVSVGNGIAAVPISLLFFSMLLMINFISIGCLFYGFGGVNIPPGDILRWVISFLSFGIIINCLLFIKNKRYKYIIKNYEKETAASVKKGNLRVVLYILATFILLGLGFYSMISRNDKLL